MFSLRKDEKILVYLGFEPQFSTFDPSFSTFEPQLSLFEHQVITFGPQVDIYEPQDSTFDLFFNHMVAKGQFDPQVTCGLNGPT